MNTDLCLYLYSTLYIKAALPILTELYDCITKSHLVYLPFHIGIHGSPENPSSFATTKKAASSLSTRQQAMDDRFHIISNHNFDHEIFPFDKLPAELRIKIYKLRFHSRGPSDPGYVIPPALLATLRVSGKLYGKSLEVLYHLNEFTLHSGNFKKFGQLNSTCVKSLRSLIANILGAFFGHGWSTSRNKSRQESRTLCTRNFWEDPECRFCKASDLRALKLLRGRGVRPDKPSSNCPIDQKMR